MKNSLDQFYTKSQTAKECLETLFLSEYDLIIEPSAGEGVFLNFLPKNVSVVAIDLEPKAAGIKKGDFFDFKVAFGKNLVVGNPPYGKNSSLAVKFFNYAAEFANTIAFILPRTFRKASIQNRLDNRFFLVKERVLSSDSFEVVDDGIRKSYAVPCVWQVWQRSKSRLRERIVTPLTHSDFEFVNENPDFLIQRVGAKAGTLTKDFSRGKEAYYWIRAASEETEQIMEQIVWDYDSPKYDTAGNPSISKVDLIAAYQNQKVHFFLTNEVNDDA